MFGHQCQRNLQAAFHSVFLLTVRNVAALPARG
jgi:hypothetical protein